MNPGVEPQERTFGPYTSFAFVVGTVVGTGIYLKPSQVTRLVPEMWQNLSLWTAGGLFALCGALVYARLAAVWPQAGGAYVYLRECYGSWAGALLMAADVLLARPAAVGALATGLGLIWGLGIHDTVLLAVATLTVLTVTHLVGSRAAGRLQVVLTVVQMLPLLFCAVGGIQLNNVSVQPTPMNAPLWASGFLAVLWAYDGWYNVTILGGEVRRPDRNLRWSLVGGVMLVTLLYVGLNGLLLMKIDRSVIAEQGIPFLGLLQGWGRPVWETGLKFALSFALLATLNGTLVCGSRMLIAGSENGLLVKLSSGIRGERRAVLLFFFWCVGMLLLFAGLPSQFSLFDQLSEYTAVVVAGLSGLTITCIFRLRRFGEKVDRCSWIGACVYLLVDLWLMALLLVERPWLAMAGAGSVLITGTVLWFLRASRIEENQ